MHTLLIYHYLSLAEGCTVGSDTDRPIRKCVQGVMIRSILYACMTHRRTHT